MFEGYFHVQVPSLIEEPVPPGPPLDALVQLPVDISWYASGVWPASNLPFAEFHPAPLSTREVGPVA
jgi:hypothetical protein